MIRTKELLEEILSGADDALKRYKGKIIEAAVLRELAADPQEEVQIFLAGRPDVPARILEHLCEGTLSPKVIRKLADNPRTPTPFLHKFARDESPMIRKIIASGRAITPQTATILCDDPDPFVRVVLAQNKVIPPSAQSRLADDEVAFVRTSLLGSPRLEDDVRSALADDLDPIVQAYALSSPKTSEETLLNCADGEDHFMQSVLLTRDVLPDKVLESLCFSRHSDIQKTAIRRKQLTQDEMLGFAVNGDEETRMYIAGLSNLPPLIQKQLYKECSPAVRLILSRNPHLCPEVAEAMMQDFPDREILVNLIGGALRQEDSLVRLAEGDNLEVLKLLADLPCPSSVLSLLCKKNNDEIFYHLGYRKAVTACLTPEQLKYLATHTLPTMRILAALAENIPVFLLAQLAKDSVAAIRLAVVQNRNVQPTLLELLLQDPDPEVRSAAEKKA